MTTSRIKARMISREEWGRGGRKRLCGRNESGVVKEGRYILYSGNVKSCVVGIHYGTKPYRFETCNHSPMNSGVNERAGEQMGAAESASPASTVEPANG